MSVKVNYPDGLEEMVHGFKLCATARLFLQDSIPHVDAGVFLDNDIVVMDDLSLLWDRFKLFSTEAAMAMAPVEAHYGVRMVRVFTNTWPIEMYQETKRFIPCLMFPISDTHLLCPLSY